MKGSMFHQQQRQQRQQQQQVVVEENMSNLTSASNEANSVSSGTKTEVGTFMAPPTTPKKKRNLPGNPGFIFIDIQSLIACLDLLFENLEQGLE